MPGLFSDGLWFYGTAGTAPAAPSPEQEEYEEPPAATDPQVAVLLSGDALEVDFGVYLLDASDHIVEDISESLESGEVAHGCYDTIHGTCTLQMTRALNWETDRVMPYMQVIGSGLEAFWHLGVYLVTTPEINLGETPGTYSVTGYDKLSLLSRPVGDTYVIASGTSYLTAIRGVITASGVTGAVLLDGTALATLLPADRVWILDSDETTYLNICNDLLNEIAYVGLHMSPEGAFTSYPYVSPATRTPTWTFDLANPRTNIVGPDRRMVRDEFVRTNWRRFIKTGLTAKPVETSPGTTTDTQYTRDDSASGVQYRKVYYIDAADGAALYASAQQTVDAETRRKTTLEITTGPLPVLWHWDVVDYLDAEADAGTVKCQIASWRMPLDGGDVSITMERV